MAEKPKGGVDEIVDSVDTKSSGDEAATDAVFAEDEFTAAPDRTRKSSRLPTVIAASAFIISMLTAAGFFYLASTSGGDEGNQVATDANLAALTESIGRTDASLSELRRSVASIEGMGAHCSALLAR